MKKIIALLFNLLVASVLTAVAGAPAFVGVAAVVAGSLFHMAPSGSFGMALQKEIWEKDIVENLFADNSFLSKAFNADMYVLSGKVVHIPQAGTAASVTLNRSSLPATVGKRTDSELTYSLDEYTTDPHLVQFTESIELSYDKRQSVMADDKAYMLEVVSNTFLYNWSPTVAGSILRTTGAAVAAHLPSATGNRKLMTLADVAQAAFTMNSQNVPQTERYCVIDSWMYFQLLADMTDYTKMAFHSQADVANGIIGKLHGFSFYQRSKAGIYTNAATPAPKTFDAAGAATDNAGAIFWQAGCVERALGEVKVFEHVDSPLYYGDIISFLVRAGGRIRRSDNKGVIALVQAATT